ncbi:General L-amino acid-binding periplasmic protein AapJ [Rhodovastum atsumiense]|uniref:Amino acid ABC transporter substrate-binding protein n=1 Tax=Rhodovastum atsumiense TaxID=504468 RepID=A0A5M6IYE9_9PROT|nr:amino acid ABC transporter substrate-binding protein [Rhodovastum atsumiense]KAA5612388.1 amino acid ABC transporter substrate-binding protein [Rhodovastum atsumiense]CAH2600292.1 General L-amino acid-binding periplasmic protein AapJ [Rhodovastum atsumiense]
MPRFPTMLACLLLFATGAHAATLDVVRSRGQLVCGVNTGVAGFSAPDPQGVYRGLDVDYCRAVAAAVLGDPAKVKYVPTTYQTRFVALQSGELDVLARNVTLTLTRETALGLLGVGVDFYDGQGFMVPKATKLTSAKQLDGATVCVLPGSTTELNLGDFARRSNIKIQPVVLNSMDTMVDTYQSGRCDAMTTDASQLAALRVSAMRDPSAHVILPERISKEPLGPFVRRGDEQWAAIAKYVLMGLIAAEELGVTQANVDAMRTSTDPDIRRLLGVEAGLGKALGIEEGWGYRMIKAVGNYGEAFDRNLGRGSPIGLDRGLNDLWTRGGLMYALPLR